jgi:hypothetical protein
VIRRYISIYLTTGARMASGVTDNEGNHAA